MALSNISGDILERLGRYYCRQRNREPALKYLSPKQLGQAIGVSESSLNRWIDDGLIEVTRTTGGHRRIDLAEAVRFVRQRGYTIADPTVLGLSAADDQTGRADAAQRADHFYDMLVNGQDKALVSAVTRLYLEGYTFAELIDGPIREAMRRIGELWHNNPDGVGIEHRATDICIRALGHMHTLVKQPADDAPLAIGGAPPGDMHLVSSLCISLVLSELGWREANLGANSPWQQLESVALREKASLVWVSMTNEATPEYPTALNGLAKNLSAVPCQVIVGGRQLSEPITRISQPNFHTARSMAELVSFSRGLLAAHRTSQARAHSGSNGRA